LAKVNSVLSHLTGTHNFHNFTSGKAFDDKSATRYIIEFKANAPIIKEDREFISISIVGQSFLIHQIRKMIGLCMSICRGFCGLEFLEKCWASAKMDVPKAPGLGLLLNRVHFATYDKRFGSDGVHSPLTWVKQEEAVERFKMDHILDYIIQQEVTHEATAKWLCTLPAHTYRECEPTNPEQLQKLLQKQREEEELTAQKTFQGVTESETAQSDVQERTTENKCEQTHINTPLNNHIINGDPKTLKKTLES